MTVDVGVLVGVLGLIVAIFTYLLSKDKNTKTETKESASVAAAIDYIKQGIDNIRIDIKTNERRVSDLSETVIRIDESTKQAHKRIDKLEQKEID